MAARGPSLISLEMDELIQKVVCANYFVQINPRLQRHFLAFSIAMPSPTSLLVILETFLGGHLRQEKQGNHFQPGVLQVSANIIKGALSIHQEVTNKFLRKCLGLNI